MIRRAFKKDVNMEISDNVILLPRGGYVVDTPAGYIQFGSPPETIKDTMKVPGSVPEIFVLASELFDWMKGISIAEIEFPLYYNFFIRKKKTFILCTEKQYSQMRHVLQESLFGPRDLDLSIDYSNENSDVYVPDIRKEMNHFRNNLKLSDLVAFGIFKDDSFTIKGVTIKVDDERNFSVYAKNEKIASVPGTFEYRATYDIGERLSEPYSPPLFGVTCLGPSHGFDPEENTSGFIIWLNHQGIMVDPPVNSTEWLEDSNVNPKHIDSIILTHCHADHDAGTFQKILEEGKVTIYTTQTVMMSFLRKYSSLSGIDIDYLMNLFYFHPVVIGKPVIIHGGIFDMFYTLHSIPTMGFRMEFQDQSFVYSSDHNNDPELHRELLEKGIITSERYDELSRFPWDSKVIYHESGVPPLHTPVAFLDKLPQEIQERTVVYHIAKKDFPADTSLTLARFGMEHTLYFETEPPPFERAYQILGLVKNIDFFDEFPMRKAQEFIDIVQEERYSKGEKIIEKGTRGDRFYIIFSGNVSVESGDLEEKKIYGYSEYFGEVALVTEQPRAADVIAETDIIVYTIQRDKFLNFILGTEFEKTLKSLARIRSSETWNLLSTSHFFRHCSASQKTWLESLFNPVEKDKPGVLVNEGEPFDSIYIIRKGEVEVYRDGREVALLSTGDFIGSIKKIHQGEPSEYTFHARGPVSVFAMKRDDIRRFAEYNPGLLMKSDTDF